MNNLFSQDDNYVKHIEPKGTSVGTLFFGHTGNHYVVLRPAVKVGISWPSYCWYFHSKINNSLWPKYSIISCVCCNFIWCVLWTWANIQSNFYFSSPKLVKPYQNPHLMWAVSLLTLQKLPCLKKALHIVMVKRVLKQVLLLRNHQNLSPHIPLQMMIWRILNRDSRERKGDQRRRYGKTLHILTWLR